MHFKRLAAFLLSFALFFTVVMPGSYSAAAANGLVVSGTEATGYAGDTVSVDVVLTENPGFSVLNLYYTYDTDVLTLTGVENRNDAFIDMLHDKSTIWDKYGDYTGTGTMATLTFEVAEDAAPGSYEVEIHFLAAGNDALEEVPGQGGTAVITVACRHSYGSVVTPPTCEEYGYTTYTCTVCGDSYTGDYVGALVHSYIPVITHPTCTDGGYTTHTCSLCGDSYVDNYTEAKGHKYVGDRIEPTCTEGGYDRWTCETCGDSYENNHVDATGHSFENGTCTVCGEADPNYVIVVYGDANGDGDVNGKDLLMLRRYMANYDDETQTSTVTVKAGADANGDGEVNGKDLLMLRRYMANYDDETETSTVVLGPRS